ncbi:MAG TPA: addiction module antidote protein [Candidatus Angelobacter sp.]
MPKRTSSYRDRLLQRLALPEEAANYLNAAMDDSTEVFLEALRDVAQARQMSAVADQAGVKRETIYRATRKTGNPTLDTLDSVLKVCGLQLSIAAKGKRSSGFKAGTPAPRAGVYAAQKRTGRRRRSAFLESVGQSRLPFGNLTEMPISSAAPHLTLEKSAQGNFGVGHKVSVVQPLVAAVQTYYPDRGGQQIPAVPFDFLGAASASAVNVTHP